MPPIYRILRPTTFDEVVGQKHLVGPGSLLRTMAESGRLESAIFFGPPGTGKTSVAEVISHLNQYKFYSINATQIGVSELKKIVSLAKSNLELYKTKTLVFCDEIHRWPKNVQDYLLPNVEDGIIILIGATTENPYFALVPPLISRSMMFEFEYINNKDLVQLLSRMIKYYKSENLNVKIHKDAAKYLIGVCSGDARKLLLAVESAMVVSGGDITLEVCNKIIPHRSVIYDRNGEGTYDILSAIQGAIQASDVHSSIFWLGRAINAGEDINVICRRLLVCAAEDVGCCNPLAMIHTNAACEAAVKVGFPEAKIILSSAVAYLAMNKRSKASLKAIAEAMEIDNKINVEIPKFLKDCHYQGAGKLGRGEYQDGHDMSKYVPVIHDLFRPENGDEVELMRHNRGLW